MGSPAGWKWAPASSARSDHRELSHLVRRLIHVHLRGLPLNGLGRAA